MATDVATALPELTLMPGSRITVTDENGTAIVTQLVVKMFQVTSPDRPTAQPILLRSGR